MKRSNNIDGLPSFQCRLDLLVCNTDSLERRQLTRRFGVVRHGLKFHEVGSIRDLRVQLRMRAYDLILISDTLSPSEDMDAILHQIRSMPAHQTVPLVLLCDPQIDMHAISSLRWNVSLLDRAELSLTEMSDFVGQALQHRNQQALAGLRDADHPVDHDDDLPERSPMDLRGTLMAAAREGRRSGLHSRVRATSERIKQVLGKQHHKKGEKST